MEFQDVFGDAEGDGFDDEESEAMSSSLNSSREFNVIESA
jgi:hypothetical protein|tara:strand:+ start:444 stop:563 length:120 start_codon:yes stop_codon:yes gene_type:complete